MRNAEIKRKTAETDIFLALDLEGEGETAIDTGIGFLDHMLTLFARHGGMALTVKCVGDTQVDGHHSAEDIGICLGSALREALGECRGITRYGSMILPMDETLILSAVDVSGRSYLAFEVDFPTQRVGDFDTELVKEFFLAFVRKAELTLHIRELAGENSHHIAEGIFKSVARSLRAAVAVDAKNGDAIPSTKGVL